MASNEISKNFKQTNPGPLDFYYGPYNSFAEACTAVPNIVHGGVNMRTGKTVGINTIDGIADYWWNKGVLDADLVLVNKLEKNILQSVHDNYVFPITDANGRFLGGFKKDGSFEIAKWLSANIPGTALKDAQVTLGKMAADVLAMMPNDNTFFTQFPENENNEIWVLPITDSNNRLLGGFKKDGSWYAAKYSINSIGGDALTNESVSVDKLNPASREYLPKDLAVDTGYVYTVLDANNRFLFGITVDGSFVASKFNYTLNDLSVTTQKLSVDLQNRLNTIASNVIACYGDSLTAGAGGNGTTYPGILATLLGSNYNVVNCGVGGEGAATIASRQGGIPAVTTEAFVLPATTTAVVISSYTNRRIKNALNNLECNLLLQGAGNSVNPCFIQGVACTLAWTGATYDDAAGTWTIARNVAAASSKSIPANSVLTFSGSKLHRNPFALILFIGQNAGYIADAGLVDYHKRMIEFSGSANYILIGLHSGTAASRATLEKAMSDAFGSRYINLREYMVNYGLADAGITPTTADNTAIAEGSCPPSLLFDAIHFTAAGYTLIGNLVHQKFKELGFINS